MEQMTKQQKAHDGSYDLLRVICTLVVINVHVSAIYSNVGIFLDVSKRARDIMILIYGTIGRFSVPCFLLLSGAFLLENNDNQRYSFFYRKKLIKIFIPTIIFTVIYFLYSMTKYSIGFFHNNYDISIFLTPIKNVIKGSPYYHMWYMYTLLGIYILIPVMIRLKLDIGDKAFAKLSWIYFFVAIASGLSTTSLLCWGLPSVVMFLGYVLIGYQIRKKSKSKKNNKKAGIFIILGFLGMFFVAFLWGMTKLKKLPLDEELFLNHFNPIIVLSSLLIFYGFSYLEIKEIRIVSLLSKDSFAIYLIHGIVIDILYLSIGFINLPELIIPLGTLIVFVISWVLARGYNKLWSIIDKGERVSGKICKLVHL